ncbi:MAG: MerR family transcriptional regulator [Sciscionella sp.]
MRIGELASLAGASTKTVRHYHHIGLLAEPQRRDNGYRDYVLQGLVRLLRARRLTELGLSLEEVADALADDDGKDLREILTELDGDLARQQHHIELQRARVTALLDGEADLHRSQELAAAVGELARAVGKDHPSVRRERLVLEVIGSLTGMSAAQVGKASRQSLADTEMGARILTPSPEEPGGGVHLWPPIPAVAPRRPGPARGRGRYRRVCPRPDPR